MKTLRLSPKLHRDKLTLPSYMSAFVYLVPPHINKGVFSFISTVLRWCSGLLSWSLATFLDLTRPKEEILQ